MIPLVGVQVKAPTTCAAEVQDFIIFCLKRYILLDGNAGEK